MDKAEILRIERIKLKDVADDKGVPKDKDVADDKGVPKDKDVANDKDVPKDKDVVFGKDVADDKDVVDGKDVTDDKDVADDYKHSADDYKHSADDYKHSADYKDAFTSVAQKFDASKSVALPKNVPDSIKKMNDNSLLPSAFASLENNLELLQSIIASTSDASIARERVETFKTKFDSLFASTDPVQNIDSIDECDDCDKMTYTRTSIGYFVKKYDVKECHNAFTTLFAALESVGGLIDTLLGDGPYTMFVPTNDAFAELNLEYYFASENKAELQSVLLYHVIAGQVLSLELCPTDGFIKVETIQGDSVTVQYNVRPVMINDANVTSEDIYTPNGVIHVIDKVLVPPTKKARLVMKVKG